MSSFGRERSTFAVARLWTLATAGTRSMSAVISARKESRSRVKRSPPPAAEWFDADGDDQRLRAAKLTAEALVIAIQRIVLGEPGADVVVDVRDIRTGKKKRRAQNERPTERNAPPKEARGEPVHAD